MPGTRPDLAAQRQLPEEAGDADPGALDLLGAEQDADGHRQVERRAGLAQVRRGEVDGDPPCREGRTRRCGWRRGPARGPPGTAVSRQADDGEPGQPGRDVHLDPDDPTIEAARVAEGHDSEHAATASGAALTVALIDAITRRMPGERLAVGDRRGDAGLVDRPGEAEQAAAERRVGLGEHERRARVEGADRARGTR